MVVNAPCPACHHVGGDLLYVVDAEAAAQHYVLREVHPARHGALRAHIETLWAQRECSLIECTSCGFTFASPYVAGDARFYALAYERSGYPGWKWEFARTQREVEALVASRGKGIRLLEIGAGDGAFVRAVTPALIPGDQVLTTEFSEYGRAAIEAYGVACVSADVRSAELDPHRGRFDVVCLFQVLEHLDGLDHLFDRLAELTAPSAALFIAVPNERQIGFNEENGALLDLPPNHIGRWTRASFEAVARRHRWRLAAHEVEPQSAASRLSGFAQYRYLRRRQDSGSIANRIERVAPKWLRRPLQAAAIGGYALGSLGALLRLARANDLGASQWVHLVREGG